MKSKAIQSLCRDALLLGDIRSRYGAIQALVLLTTATLPAFAFVAFEYYETRRPLLLIPAMFFLLWGVGFASNLAKYAFCVATGKRCHSAARDDNVPE